MKRTTIWITEEQHDYLMELSKTSGKNFSDHIREAIDRQRATTGYIDGMAEIAEEVHPWMTYEQFIGWLQFRYRLKFEGKDRNGDDKIIAMLTEILEILRHDDPTDYTDHG